MDKPKKVIIYSTPDCAYCYTIKDYLNSKSILFEDINIYEDDKWRKEMEELSGQQNVPVTIIWKEVIIGWDKNKINTALIWKI